MGIFDFFKRPDFRSAAIAIKSQALGIDLSAMERQFAQEAGIDLAKYVLERNLMRVGVSSAAVYFFFVKAPHEKALRDLSDHLTDLYKQFFSGLPNAPEGYENETMSHVKESYPLADPEVVASRLLNNLTDGMAANTDPLVAAPLVEIVRAVVKEVLLTVGNQVKRIRN